MYLVQQPRIPPIRINTKEMEVIGSEAVRTEFDPDREVDVAMELVHRRSRNPKDYPDKVFPKL